jgi:hypothetical protein
MKLRITELFLKAKEIIQKLIIDLNKSVSTNSLSDNFFIIWFR